MRANAVCPNAWICILISADPDVCDKRRNGLGLGVTDLLGQSSAADERLEHGLVVRPRHCHVPRLFVVELQAPPVKIRHGPRGAGNGSALLRTHLALCEVAPIFDPHHKVVVDVRGENSPSVEHPCPPVYIDEARKGVEFSSSQRRHESSDDLNVIAWSDRANELRAPLLWIAPHLNSNFRDGRPTGVRDTSEGVNATQCVAVVENGLVTRIDSDSTGLSPLILLEPLLVAFTFQQHKVATRPGCTCGTERRPACEQGRTNSSDCGHHIQCTLVHS